LISQLIDISGASDVVGEAHVTYSNEVKERLLGVSHDTLSEYGAVSEECAREMAEGVRRISGADYGLSTTGIAGPGGGTPEKPVGTVFVGLASNDGTEVIKLSLRGDRTRIRSMTCLQALNLLRLKLLKDHD
ncbi:MAG: nicotinamide-nucleotide amidohydrolase family protein, partial [Clostridia bacterium]|nr:nicotinamide-nucleotide amidohydrolase family protein [Clostridia bacterium]